MQPGAIAVSPWRGRMRLNFNIEIDAAHAPQGFAQNFDLDLHLLLIFDVLILAPTASLEIRAVRINAPSRCALDMIKLRSCEACAFFGQMGINDLSGQNKRDEHSFASSLICRTAVGSINRKACKALAAVDHAFDGKVQNDPLWWLTSHRVVILGTAGNSSVKYLTSFGSAYGQTSGTDPR